MKIAVIGCGAIGGLFLGYLTEKGHEVIGIVKDYQREHLVKEGLSIEGVRGRRVYQVHVATSLEEEVEFAILATKVNDVEGVLSENIGYLQNAVILTTQNGIRADYILEDYTSEDRIATGIVMFGATYYPPVRIVHNFEGDLVVGNLFSNKTKEWEEIEKVLREVFTVSVASNIKGAKYLKVFINLNNCIPAILGVSMQGAFADLELAELAMRLNREAYTVVKKAGIALGDLPTYPKERLEGLVSMDLQRAGKIFSQIMTSLSKEPLYGSILQSIQRGRRSEIDYINGEIVGLAEKNGLDAPLNRKAVDLVHRVEDSGRFFSKEQLLAQIECNY